MTEFKQIDAAAYFQEHAEQAKLYRKDVTILARPAVPGETIVTVTSGGHEETVNTAGDDQYVVQNPGGEQYIIGKDKFESRYSPEPDDDLPQGFQRYRAVGGPMPCVTLDEPVSFTAPWGSPMTIQAGGVLVNGGGTDVYGIQPDEFQQTYRACQEDGTFL